MIQIIKQHITTYPEMEIQDVFKLLFQSEFGGGHLISDSQSSLERIQKEYEQIQETVSRSKVEIETVGDGMCRVYLHCLSKGMRAEVLNEMFIKSAAHKTGTVEGLEGKIKAFQEACERGALPFAVEEVNAFWRKWKENGYPAMSHSPRYRECYRPAYRIVEESYKNIYEVISEIEKRNRKGIVAIDGMAASGKTTLGMLLHLNYPESNLFHVDDYFLQPHQRTEERLREVGGNFDYERLEEEIISHLKDSDGINYRPYDCQTQSLKDEIHVPWSSLVFVEGCYSQHPRLGLYYDVKVFCEIDSEEQVRRIRERNGEYMLNRFVTEWIPKENQYFEKYKLR